MTSQADRNGNLQKASPQQSMPSSTVAPERQTRAEWGATVLMRSGYARSVAAHFQLSPAELEVPVGISLRQEVEWHAVVLNKLREGLNDAQNRKDFATKRKDEPGMFDQYLAAEQDAQNTLKYLAPYAIAQGKAQIMKDEGYLLTQVSGDGDWGGQACNAQGQCTEVDPMIVLLMMLIDAVAGEYKKDKPFGENNDLTKAFTALLKFVNQPLGGPNSDLVKIRDAILAHDQRGEIAKLIRDPIKRPIEIVQEIRDDLIDPDDNGEIAKAIRDPINCTIGHIWGGCD